MNVLLDGILANMNRWSWWDALFASLPQGIIMYAIIAIVAGKNPVHEWRKIITAAIVALVPVAFLGEGITFFIMMAYLIVSARYFLKITWKQAAIGLLPALITTLFSAILLASILTAFGVSFIEVRRNGLSYLAITFLYLLAYALFTYILYRHKNYFLPKWRVIYQAAPRVAAFNLALFYLLVAVGGSVALLLLTPADWPLISHTVMLCVMIAILIISIYQTYSIFRFLPIIEHNMELARERDLIENVQFINYLIKDDFQARVDNYQALRMAIVSRDIEQMTEVADDMAKKLEEVRGVMIHAHDPALQTMLWGIKRFAGNHHFDLQVDGVLTKPSKISMMDLTVILANAVGAGIRSSEVSPVLGKRLMLCFDRQDEEVRVCLRYPDAHITKEYAQEILSGAHGREEQRERIISMIQLIEKHGGKMTSEIKENRDAQFVLHFPA